jgi:hypothetical protein
VRPILALAVVLVALTFLIENERWVLPRGDAHAGADRALEIVAGAKGRLLPTALIGSGPERIGHALRIGERTLVPGRAVDGLRSALLDPEGRLESQRIFESSSAEDARALRETVERARPGSLLVLASSGRIEPPAGDESARTELRAALDGLHARARPGLVSPESWALVALRREDGWVPLAESYSRDSGVALSYVLGAARELPPVIDGDFAEVRAPEEVEVFLEEELDYADERSPGCAVVRDRRVLGRTLAGILQPPVVEAGADAASGATASRILWRGVSLGAGSGFLAWVGLADGAGDESDGVVFELWVAGERVLAQPVQPRTPWTIFLADLRPFAGRTVDLELRVEPGASAEADAALWGKPMLLHGYQRSPLAVWAERR